MTPIHNIVVATDFSPGAAAAVDRAVRVSALPPTRLSVPDPAHADSAGSCAADQAGRPARGENHTKKLIPGCSSWPLRQA